MTAIESLPNQKHLSQKHKNLIVLASGVIIVIVLLIAPIIPTQHTVTKTRTRNLLYSSQLFDKRYVNVTNWDSIGGNFSVTMNYWVISPMTGERVSLVNTSTQSLFINAGASQAFYVPNNWHIYVLDHSIDYSVSASTQESYQGTQTEYKSTLDLIHG